MEIFSGLGGGIERLSPEQTFRKDACSCTAVLGHCAGSNIIPCKIHAYLKFVYVTFSGNRTLRM